MVLEIR
jgi:hypothetical protein